MILLWWRCGSIGLNLHVEAVDILVEDHLVECMSFPESTRLDYLHLFGSFGESFGATLRVMIRVIGAEKGTRIPLWDSGHSDDLMTGVEIWVSGELGYWQPAVA